jgi:diguanylate cyclase (GGDEF)-like protein
MIKHHIFGTAIAICIGLALTTVIGGSYLFLQRTYQARLAAADMTLQNAALVVERVVNRHLLQVDSALVSLPDLFPIAAQDALDFDPASASRLLRTFNHETFNFRDILLVRRDGHIWASARPDTWQARIPLEVFRSLLAAPVDAAALAGPIRNPVTGDWDLLLMRPVSLPGVGAIHAVAEIPLSLVTVLFSAVPEIPGLRIALKRRDGRLIVSQPYDEMQIGARQAPAMSPGTPDGVPSLVPAGIFQAPTLTVARASLYPDLMIAVTLDLNIAMADWRRERDRLIAVMAVTVVLLSALTVTLIAERRARERAAADRNRARAVLDSAIEAMSEGFVMWDSENRLVLCNQRYRDIYAISADLLRSGALFEDIIRGGAELGQYPDVGDDIEAFVRTTAAWQLDNDGPMERRLPDGRWALVSERTIPGGGRVGIRTDITDLKLALADLEAANEKARQAKQEVELQNAALRDRDHALHIQNVLFDAALNNMSQGLLMIDGNGQVIVHNTRFLLLFGINATAITSPLLFDDLFARLKFSGRLTAEMIDNIYVQQRHLADTIQPATFVVTADNHLSISVSQQPIVGGGWVATYQDVSEQRRAEEHIRFAAHHDALTKLPNRMLFRTRLDEMTGVLEHRQTGLALLYLDLDRFKHVNDTLGHPVGDALLVAAGRRLLGCVRSSDMVARLGGDEFAVAYMSQDLPEAATQTAERIIKSLAEPYILGGHTAIVGVSIGIAFAFDAHTDADTLLKNADMALYHAKAEGRGICSLFEPLMEQELIARLAIEEDLRHAVDREEFLLLYQPLWDLRSDQIAGFEALIRWHHPIQGVVSPAQFIPVAEDTGLIRRIGAWVIEKACADAMLLPDHTSIAVNLSAAQLDSGDIVEVVAAALQSTELPAHRLELEITETALLKNNENTLAALARLHALGVRIALDDFGTGYSSLSHLRSFPFDKVKIDQSFVREMASRTDCAAIVSSIVDLATKLNIITTAEGIETVDQLDLVRTAGCTEAQGYLFSVPRSLQEWTEYFQAQIQHKLTA